MNVLPEGVSSVLPPCARSFDGLAGVVDAGAGTTVPPAGDRVSALLYASRSAAAMTTANAGMGLPAAAGLSVSRSRSGVPCLYSRLDPSPHQGADARGATSPSNALRTGPQYFPKRYGAMFWCSLGMM